MIDDLNKELNYKEYVMREDYLFHAPYNPEIEFYKSVMAGDKKLGFELRLETYDVFGVEKRLIKPISIEGIKDKKLIAKTADGNDCDFLLVEGVYEVYDLEALNSIEYNRYYPARGYYKRIK